MSILVITGAVAIALLGWLAWEYHVAPIDDGDDDHFDHFPEHLLKRVGPNRWVVADDDQEICRECRELPVATVDGLCARCFKSIEDDRLERE